MSLGLNELNLPIVLTRYITSGLVWWKPCKRTIMSWLCFYQTRSAWSVDQGSNKNHSPAYNFEPTVTKFSVMWEGLSLPHDTKFGNCRCKIVDSRAFPSWSLIHGLRWAGLMKAEPEVCHSKKIRNLVQRLSNYTPQKTTNVVTYSCPNFR